MLASPNSWVIMVTILWHGRPRDLSSCPGGVKRFSLSLICPDRHLNLTKFLFSGNLGHTLEVRCATEPLEVKNHWSYTSTPPCTYEACTGKTLLCMSPTEQRLWCRQLIDINWISFRVLSLCLLHGKYHL